MARTSTTKISARERAPAAKAKLDAQLPPQARRGRGRHLLRSAGRKDAAHEALAAAETARAAAVNALSELGESVTRISSLTGLDPREVRKLKRTASTPDKDADTDGTAGGSEVEETSATDPSTGPSAVAS